MGTNDPRHKRQKTTTNTAPLRTSNIDEALGVTGTKDVASEGESYGTVMEIALFVCSQVDLLTERLLRVPRAHDDFICCVVCVSPAVTADHCEGGLRTATAVITPVLRLQQRG